MNKTELIAAVAEKAGLTKKAFVSMRGRLLTILQLSSLIWLLMMVG